MGATTVHTNTITDNDAPPSVAFTLASSSIAEDGVTAIVVADLSAPSGRPVTVDYTITGGSATGAGKDYTLAAGTLVFIVEDPSEGFTISIVDDALDEIDEDVVITLSNPADATLGVTTIHALTITDNDAAPT